MDGGCVHPFSECLPLEIKNGKASCFFPQGVHDPESKVDTNQRDWGESQEGGSAELGGPHEPEFGGLYS